MEHGPIDFIMIGFEDAQPSSTVAEGILSLVQSGTIRIIDLLFVSKNAEGDLRVLELTELEDNVYEVWDTVVQDVEGMLTAEDALHLASDLPADKSAVLALFENVWAREMAAIIQNANGEVLINTRIPRDVIAEIEAAYE
ncbi:MAG: DUF6325 family protein [Thermomicrobiales bacterium]|nr:DUF6325 family protein [Thermomicrobiales bacterium]MCO5218499.1 DUF6325 family protein [Thermomicrobiales bacterium]MCO5224789.1 DUF6325 family protein [Thermomicrobiales bacterium]MCO5227600.1 DUF6325 family protein [Thermomicrobiales bacterium]